MLTVSSITNVKNTINNYNKKISFTSGVRTNKGADIINNTTDAKHEGSFLTDFLGTIKQSPLFLQTFQERQQKIENGIQNQTKETKKIDAIA